MRRGERISILGVAKGRVVGGLVAGRMVLNSRRVLCLMERARRA